MVKTILTDLAGIVTAIAAIVGAIVSIHNRGKIQEVHLLVNSQLDDVLAQLEAMTKERDNLKEENGKSE